MAPNDDVRYPGPTLGISPPIGDNQYHGDATSSVSAPSGYADLGILRNLLTQLKAALDSLDADLNEELVRFVLPVTTDSGDIQLRQAHDAEWPTALGIAKDIVTYRYYKALELRDSSAATYIRKRYEEAARNVTGTSALDLSMLSKIIRDECNLAEEFIDTHVGILDDSSERRTVELLQDWANAGIRHTANLQLLFDTRDSQRTLPDSDVGQISPEDASHSQAIFKVNLNKINADLGNSIAFLKKNFSDYASTFYNNFLGPALSFRLNVTRKIYPILPGQLGREVNSSVSSLDNQFSVVLADQTRRNVTFNQKMTELTDQVQLRDTYRSYITQLAPIGTPIPPGGARTLAAGTDTSEEATYFDNVIQTGSQNASIDSYHAPHSLLSGVDDPEAHPQYLLKTGGEITGDIKLADGVLIDGVSPHVHRHTGADGTLQVRGSDILPASVDPNVVDPNAKPSTPIGLTLEELDTVAGDGGALTFSALISWTGDPNTTFEVQVARVL